MNQTMSYRDWHIPFLQDQITLREAQRSMEQVRAAQVDVPLMVQLVENPKYRMPGFCVFHGAVDLVQHDYIHIVLGRGLLEQDEAFTIGFTMGSTKKVTTTEENLYAFISKHLYPKVYQLADHQLEVFKDAVRLGYISSCVALDEFRFDEYLDMSLEDVRDALGLEKDLILAYYKIEYRRYPNSRASQRLLNY